ncbi:MAG: sugar phosphate isomerase/epimerase [Firmicutes bacterium]|nr:sugar phosphate isomerase/epimerase [Bacillota bacterium]
MKRNTIAAQLYTLRDHLKTPEQIASSLQRVRAIGYEAVQVSGLGPIDPVELKALTDDSGLQICATHVSYDSLKNHLPDVIRTHQLWACEYVGLGMLPEVYRNSKEGYEAFVREFSEIGRHLADHNLHLVYHNHDLEFVRFDGVTGLDLLLQGASPQTYSLELDTYWVQAGGASPIEWIEKAAGQLKVIHLKDMAVDGRTAVMAEIGEGNFNWPAIIEACRNSGVQWYAVEQDVCKRDPFESLAISFSYLSNLC